MKYLLSDDEYQRYGRLKTPEARKAFVDRFWRKRDPDLTTPENEFRDRFETLCRKADSRFVESPQSGWRTDRGRVMILLGEPDSVRRDAGDARGRDREIWAYGHPPGGGVPVEIFFYRNRSGQFTLLPDEETPQGPVERERERQRIRGRLRVENLGMPGFALDRLTELLMGPGANFLAPETPREQGLHRSRTRGALALSGPPYESESLMSEATYFFQSADRSVLVLLALEFRPAAGAPGSSDLAASPDAYVARAWVVDATGAVGGLGTTNPEEEIQLEVPEGSAEGHSVLFVGRAHLEPGSYALRLAVLDSLHRSLAVRSVDLEVPELGSGRFSASSVVPAERFGKVPDGKQSLFAVGSEEVVPRPDGRFRRGEPLRIYLQVYEAEADPLSGKPRVDVQFRFQRAARGVFKSFGKPLVVTGAEGASMGLALPVGNWPSGDYRVVVELHDRVSGARTETSGAFSLSD